MHAVFQWPPTSRTSGPTLGRSDNGKCNQDDVDQLFGDRGYMLLTGKEGHEWSPLQIVIPSAAESRDL